MSSLGFKSKVFHKDVCLGEVDAIPVKNEKFQFPNNEIIIHHISSNSERCFPLSILRTISSSVRCKLEPPSSTTVTTTTPAVDQSQLINLHASCFYELKTAVVLIGNEELHLVAMPSKQKRFPCFWCYSVPINLYEACLRMLNLRCLSIVFDLDETLIVANTMKSFEDRIEALRSWISRENDPMRISGMSNEMKRYIEDRALLKQYKDNDCVVENGKSYNVVFEEVPPLFDGPHERVVRPVIRLPEKNIVLTRIFPENRDTSVLVRLRPSWEDLRSYLTAKGRKRFEVYVCTLAERNYAFEMWRLLDPEAHLISLKQQSKRIVCVKAGSRKSLLNVFQDGNCHPKMAMVIDDRLKVWEDMDQPRVHVVPPFSPYYAPQAETANAVPVLCVARNVACNVRGCFFREFDENLLRRIPDVFYEDDVSTVPASPDVSNFLISEDASFVPNGNSHAPIAEGINGPEVAQRLNQLDGKNETKANEQKTGPIQPPPVAALPNVFGMAKAGPTPSEKPSILGNPYRRESSFHMNATGAHQFQAAPSMLNVSRPPMLQVKHAEANIENDMRNLNLPLANQSTERGVQKTPSSSNGSEEQADLANANVSQAVCISALQEIGRKCQSKVEFKPVVSTSRDLQFSVEVFFANEKISVGSGKTRKDAQQQAAENALRNLADQYLAYVGQRSQEMNSEIPEENNNGFLWESADPEGSGTEEDGGPNEVVGMAVDSDEHRP